MKLKDEKKQALMARKNRNLIFSALIWMGGGVLRWRVFFVIRKSAAI